MGVWQVQPLSALRAGNVEAEAMTNVERAKEFLLTLDLGYMKHRSDPDLVIQLDEDARRLADMLDCDFDHPHPEHPCGRRRVPTSPGSHVCEHPKFNTTSDACVVSCSVCGERWSVAEYMACVEKRIAGLEDDLHREVRAHDPFGI